MKFPGSPIELKINGLVTINEINGFIKEAIVKVSAAHFAERQNFAAEKRRREQGREDEKSGRDDDKQEEIGQLRRKK